MYSSLNALSHDNLDNPFGRQVMAGKDYVTMKSTVERGDEGSYDVPEDWRETDMGGGDVLKIEVPVAFGTNTGALTALAVREGRAGESARCLVNDEMGRHMERIVHTQERQYRNPCK